MYKYLILALALVMIAGVSVARADLVNGGFESGDLTGWTPESDVSASVVTHFSNPDFSETYDHQPQEPKNFLVVSTSNFYDAPARVLSSLFTLNPGDIIKGYAAFDTSESPGPSWPNAPDFGFVDIFDVNDDEEELKRVWSKNADVVLGSGDGYSTWEFWSWSPVEAGTYYLAVGAANVWDSQLQSYALFDNIQIDRSNVVPEPVSTTLFLLGGGALVGRLYKRRKS